ncbi:response regulator [Enterocloster citroniae]|uniref:Stage 0 sporulation protein A homolog n=1 Tax=Enterocloster citroniae TaxID=358743 RepID=A0AA41FEP3_9FIRM|nr:MULTISPECIES: ATP-binding protein [Clostridia]MBT9810151.1 response regulator [Enterocloster citroniae]RGC10826.1 response regulator [Enterocloster citroniae]
MIVGKQNGVTGAQRMEDAKRLASRLMHLHYCENDVDSIISAFAPEFLWMGAGEDEYIAGRQACTGAFRQMKGEIPRCNIWDEEYDVIQPAAGFYIVTGRMWIATDPSTRMYLKVHQRVSFVFQETDEGLKCSHIHCSNPYQEMMEGEQFPEKIGRQSYEYVQERLNRLEEEMQKKNLQAEEDARRLREQTGLLSSIYDTVPCGIIRFSRSRDKGYRLISANRAALTLLGYDSVEEGLRDWHDGVLGTVLREDQERLRDCYLKLQSPGDRQDMEYRAQWKDGSIHWMDGTNMVVGTTPEGDYIIQRTLVDITARKTLQQQLDREQEMYRVAMEASAAVMYEYLMDSDTFISYEPRLGEGILRGELHPYSKALVEQQIVHPDDVPMVIDNICKGRAEAFEVRCATPGGKKGEYIWYRVNSRLIQEDGKPGRVVGALYNIHSMKSLLFENSERLHMNQSALLAINGVYVSIFYVNLPQDSYYGVRVPDARETKLLPRAGKFSSILRSYILNQVDDTDWHKIELMCDKDWLMQMITQKNEHMEAEFRMAAGASESPMWLRLEIHLVAMEGGRPKTVILAFRNISSEKQKELEHREEERKAKQALEEAYAAANRANQAKSEFLSKMSHDIRTPMNAILGMAAVAEGYLEDKAKVADCLSKIRMSGDHLLGLINAVLDMSKIESGSVCLTESVFSLNGMMREIGLMIRPDTEQKEQHLEVYVGDLSHDAVYGDLVRVKEVLLNLLSNAVKYTPKKGCIRAALEEKPSGKDHVGCYEFTVEDNGIGMSPAFQEKMFTPFERAADARVRGIQGTGLGLAITRNLVQMMNGTIQVESRLDEGTRFVVTVFMKLAGEKPEEDGQAPGKAKDKAGEPAGEKAGAQTAGEKAGRCHNTGNPSGTAAFEPGARILLAEDNDLNREIVQELLMLQGLETACAVNGREAVDLFAGNPPGTYALILMDIQMPVMNGYEASRAIRTMGERGERPDGAEIPIIALTANAFADDVYRAKQAGMNEHIAKPLEIDRLLEVMHRWMDK